MATYGIKDFLEKRQHVLGASPAVAFHRVGAVALGRLQLRPGKIRHRWSVTPH